MTRTKFTNGRLLVRKVKQENPLVAVWEIEENPRLHCPDYSL